MKTIGLSEILRTIGLDVNGSKAKYITQISASSTLIRSGNAKVTVSSVEEVFLDYLAQYETGDFLPISDLAAKLATEIVRNGAADAEVRLATSVAGSRWTPVSGKHTVESYGLNGIAYTDGRVTRTLTGVSVQGMAACPNTQSTIRSHALAQLGTAGFSPQDAALILEIVPGASQNYRGYSSLLIGSTDQYNRVIRADDLIELLESSMSSETYGLLKRPDEHFVVTKAQRNARSAEEIVDTAISLILSFYADFPTDSFASVRHDNLESVHKHNTFAQVSGTFSQFAQQSLEHTNPSIEVNASGWLRARRCPTSGSGE